MCTYLSIVTSWQAGEITCFECCRPNKCAEAANEQQLAELYIYIAVFFQASERRERLLERRTGLCGGAMAGTRRISSEHNPQHKHELDDCLSCYFNII